MTWFISKPTSAEDSDTPHAHERDRPQRIQVDAPLQSRVDGVRQRSRPLCPFAPE